MFWPSVNLKNTSVLQEKNFVKVKMREMSASSKQLPLIEKNLH